MPLPRFECILQSWDTAYTEKTTGDPSACTTWGIFKMGPGSPTNVMLLDAFAEHIAFPELRDRVYEEYRSLYGENDKPVDIVLIENKGSGISLIQELQRTGVPINEYNPGKADKVSRAHVITHLPESGRVILPESSTRSGTWVSWADSFMHQLMTFPNAKHDDLVDTFTQAMRWFKDTGWLSAEGTFIQSDTFSDIEEGFGIDYNSQPEGNPYAM